MKRRLGYLRQMGENPVSLFPFLAVLICTMGILILLLVILVRQARLKALAEARAASGVTMMSQDPIPTEEELRRLEEDLEWQAEQIRLSREKTQQDLREARAILGHLEDSIRELWQEILHWQERLKELAAMESNEGQRSAFLEKQRAELATLRQRIEDLKNKLEEMPSQPPVRSYAIIPYEGPHGTTRRPIYLECRADAVILQPEGIRFTPQDFLGSLGPGNPLDAALRAVREELLARRQFDPQKDGEPYPLLIVRPSGIEAYYAARAAMMTWGTEFGYELVEEDWQLVYPEPDPTLARVVQEAVDLARRRQEFLARSAPGRYGGRLRQFRPAPYVGGAIEEGAFLGSGGPTNDPMLARWQEKARTLARGVSSGSQAAGMTASHELAEQSGAAGATVAEIPESGSALSQITGSVNGQIVAPSPQDRQECAGAGGPGSLPNGPQAQESLQQNHIAVTPGVSGIKPLAERYGQDWGLPQRERGAIPVTRPIKIECFSDRLVLVPDDRLGKPRVFRFDHGMEKAVEELVKAVGETISGWGIAGRGMYWRPILRVHVAQGAEATYQSLQVLLSGSGLIVEKVPIR